MGLTHPNTTDMTTPSKNAIAQAIKVQFPGVTAKQFFKILETPKTRLSTARYWEESYNIRPWAKRTPAERVAALAAAEAAIAKAQA
jgi:hypothetical protein